MAARKVKTATPEKPSSRSAAAPRRPRENGHAPSAGNIPATSTMLAQVRTELLERMDQQERSFKAEIHGIRAEIHGVKAENQGIKAEMHGVKAEVARIAFLVEEQNARNKVVLDALVAFIDRQGRVEQRMDEVERTVRSLASARAPG